MALLLTIIVLVMFHNFPQFSVAGDTSNSGSGTSSSTSQGTTDAGSNNEMDQQISTQYATPTPTASPTPEPTFIPQSTPEFGVGGGFIALVICFAAFAVFMKRGQLFKTPRV